VRWRRRSASHLTVDDLVAFTGSHDTAQRIRGHRNVIEHNVPVNIEADSINAAILAPDGAPGSPIFDAFVREVAREITVKVGQKCTAIRRIFVPTNHAAAAAEALVAKLKSTLVGDPRRDDVRMGPVVTRVQQAAAQDGIGQLAAETETLCGGKLPPKLEGIDEAKAAFVSPTLLRAKDAGVASAVHQIEVFGPVATLLSFADTDQAISLVRRGGGSLVASIFSADPDFLSRCARYRIASWPRPRGRSVYCQRPYRPRHCNAAVQSRRTRPRGQRRGIGRPARTSLLPSARRDSGIDRTSSPTADRRRVQSLTV
jgi:3,4-dehydroadipyl-CoA semialdehyde dehydrogenase